MSMSPLAAMRLHLLVERELLGQRWVLDFLAPLPRPGLLLILDGSAIEDIVLLIVVCHPHWPSSRAASPALLDNG
jgi:hypothetical protein